MANARSISITHCGITYVFKTAYEVYHLHSSNFFATLPEKSEEFYEAAFSLLQFLNK